MIAIFFLLILFAFTAIGWLPFLLTLFYFIVSGFTFLMYGLDKWLALKERQRISENKLHLFALIGGWPGAYIGQQVFRHKISKSSFLHKFLLMLLINVVALAALLVVRYQQEIIDLKLFFSLIPTF
ncbi:MAG: uncharacterized membrane protein YsdA (DUF1294 family) [Oleispira sp.]|jgi:uncharacterized membrane protein YsdA (DUF1294 family)